MDLTGLGTAIVGGGIGGMAAAIVLARQGAAVTVYEQAPALEEVGAGLQVSINGQRALRALGVVAAGQVPDAASLSAGTRMIDGRSGREVAMVPGPRGGPTWYIHRADLLGLLVNTAQDAGVKVELGRLLSPGAVQADLIVAADGVKSVWRNTVDGPVLPAFTGRVAWRALVPWDGAVPGSAALVMGHRAHIVAYPLRAGRLMNLVAVEDRRDWQEEGWRISGDAEAFRARFSDFRGAVQDIIARVQDVHIWALHARPVAQRWTDGHVALLGDAAHPTLPFMAQGACLALEDAAVLGRELARAQTLEAGLRAYQDIRRPRAEQVVALARGNGWRFHMGWPFSLGANLVLGLGAGALARRLEWVYGYDVAATGGGDVG